MLTQQTTNTWRNLESSTSLRRVSLCFSPRSNGQESSAAAVLAIAFHCKSNQAGNGNTHQKASNTHGAAIHLASASPAATHCARARFSRWQRHLQRQHAFEERATWQDFLPGLEEAFSLPLAADRFYQGISASTQGCEHATDTRRRSRIRRAISLGRWLQATACSTWQLEDAVREDTQLQQVRRGGNRTPTDMRRLTVIITCTLQAIFLLLHPLLNRRDICLQQLHASWDEVIHGMLRQKWSDESLFPIDTLGGDKKLQNGISQRCTTRTWPKECRWT